MELENVISDNLPTRSLPPLIDAKVVVLNNFLCPHHWKQMQACSQVVREMVVLLSTAMEPNRDWTPDWGELDVQVQKNLTFTHRWRHPVHGKGDHFIHVPYDTGRRLRQLKPDVIISYEMGMRTLFSSRFAARHPSVPLVMVANISEQTEKDRGRMRMMLRRHLQRKVDLVTYNGPSCYRYLTQQGYSSDRLLPFPYCHDDAPVYSGPLRPVNDFAKRLFYCGRLSERKGLLPFCKALAKWCKKNPGRQITLAIAGTGELQYVLETMVLPKNLEFEFLGFLSPCELPEQYEKADLVAFPTLTDEWGLITNESLASGTPLIASVCAQSTLELCKDGENSWVYDPEIAGDLEAAVDRALQTPPERLREIRDRGREAVAHITLERSVQHFSDIVNTALALKKK